MSVKTVKKQSVKSRPVKHSIGSRVFDAINITLLVLLALVAFYPF